jgi:hypothetical protein
MSPTQRSFFTEFECSSAVVPLDKSPVHRHVPDELIAGGTDKRQDPERILLNPHTEETKGEDDNGRGVLQSVEVVRPSLASLHRASQALHQSDPEWGESEEREKDVAIESSMLPSW